MSGVLSKTFSLKHLEDVSSLCNFESENKKSMRLLCVLSKITEMAIDWLQYRRRTKYASTRQVEYDEYYPKLSNPVINEINKVLAQHYGFTEEELDFIINYDIKYRTGRGVD